MSADELRGVLALYALAHKPEPVRVASVKEAIAIVDAFELDTQGGAPEANRGPSSAPTPPRRRAS